MSVLSSPKKSPLKEMPDCWGDDTRMTSLFAPFRDRSLNPHDWDSKCTFWKAMIERWCIENCRVSFCLEDLNKAFLRNGRIPLCLAEVLKEMRRERQTCLKSDFTCLSKPSETWSGWTADILLKRPAGWAWKTVKNMVVSPPETLQTEYVHLSALKHFDKHISSSADCDARAVLIDASTLLAKCKLSAMPSSDAQLLIHWMQYQGHVAVVSEWNKQKNEMQTLVKLQPLGSRGKTCVTDLDRSIFALNCNEQALIRNIEMLEKERQEALDLAKSYLIKGMRSTAKTCLRKKKGLENCIEKRANALENVQHLLGQIRDAESDSQIFESYKLGVAALKQTFKDAGLTEDSAANAMEDVQEVLDIHSEIQSALSQPIDSGADDDLESELADLLMADTPNAPSGGGGGLDDSISGLDQRLEQLGIKGSPSKSRGFLNLPDTPQTGLSQLPDTPVTMPSTASDL